MYVSTYALLVYLWIYPRLRMLQHIWQESNPVDVNKDLVKNVLPKLLVETWFSWEYLL